jgi:TPR repeat protein
MSSLGNYYLMVEHDSEKAEKYFIMGSEHGDESASTIVKLLYDYLSDDYSCDPNDSK